MKKILISFLPLLVFHSALMASEVVKAAEQPSDEKTNALVSANIEQIKWLGVLTIGKIERVLNSKADGIKGISVVVLSIGGRGNNMQVWPSIPLGL